MTFTCASPETLCALHERAPAIFARLIDLGVLSECATHPGSYRTKRGLDTFATFNLLIMIDYPPGSKGAPCPNTP